VPAREEQGPEEFLREQQISDAFVKKLQRFASVSGAHFDVLSFNEPIKQFITRIESIERELCEAVRECAESNKIARGFIAEHVDDLDEIRFRLRGLWHEARGPRRARSAHAEQGDGSPASNAEPSADVWAPAACRARPDL